MVPTWYLFVALTLGVAIGLFLFALMTIGRHPPPTRIIRGAESLGESFGYDGERLNEPRTA